MDREESNNGSSLGMYSSDDGQRSNGFWRLFLRRSLFLKFAGSIVLIVLLTVGSMSYVSIHWQSEVIEKELIERNNFQAEEISFAVKKAFYSMNWVYVKDLLAKASDCEEILWISILKPGGEIYLSVKNEHFDENQTSHELSFDKSDRPSRPIGVSWLNDLTVCILKPIEMGKEKWFLWMGGSLRTIEAMKKRIILQSLLWGGFIALLGGIISFVLSKRISNPIVQLARASEDITRGNFEQEIPISSSDEIGVLTKSFNDMASSLRCSRGELVDERDKLEKAHRYLQTVIDFIVDPLVVIDNNYRITLANQAFLKAFDVNEIVGHGLTCYQAFHRRENPCEPTNNACWLNQVIASKDRIKSTITKRNSEGGNTVWDVVSSPVFDETGEVSKIIESFHDITELKLAEEALRNSKEKYRMVVENANEAILVLQNGEFKYANPKSEHIAGYTRGNRPTDTFMDFIHPDDREMVLERYQKRLRGEQIPNKYPFRIMDMNGQVIWVEINAVLGNWEGELATLVFLSDISDRKKSEEALKIYQERLEQMVEERTRALEITQKELVNKAMEAGRAQLSAMVMHNIGNAITPVKVQIEGMKTNELDQISHYLEKCYLDIHEHIQGLEHYISAEPRGIEVFSFMGKLVDNLKKQAERRHSTIERIDEAVSYISEILTLQQAYAAGQKETQERIDLNVVIEDAIRMQTSALEKRGITVQMELDPVLPKLVMNKNKLMQVIVNFIKNSYEAIDELEDRDKERTIVISSSTENGKVGFEVRDNGNGIERQHLDTIFKFGESNKGSSGFGLCYCKTFVEGNGGTIQINSPGKGKGTTVKVVWEDSRST